MNTLHKYWNNGIFPINDLHQNRQPYFIDKFNTYCAVGYLIKMSGKDAIAREIHDKQNYSYLFDINHPQLMDWAFKSGLTLGELALIQPTYGGEMPPVLMEMHYNNVGTDVNEYIEVKQGNYTVTFDQVLFYNQSSMLYKTLPISQMQNFVGGNYYYTFPSNESFSDAGYIELKNGSGLVCTITYSSTSVTVAQVAWINSTKTYNVGESESTTVGNSLGFTGFYAGTSWNLIPGPNSMGAINPGASFPTPITLSKFDYSINNKKINLAWETVSEINNNYFSIEKSSDGINFQAIGKVNGAGTSNSIKQYSFVDDKPAYINQYRLKQVDFDGKFTTSKILFVKVQMANPLSIVSNPVKKQLQVQVNLETAKAGSLSIFDFMGRKIKTFNAINGLQNLDVQTLTTGKYLLQLTTKEGQAFNQQFIKAE
ncbi:MAG: T9SS type A sorting domain-containing protein [Chitinophagaceae bacterium]|nr:T9SS type A sorting domain-containing protein [Chitinophagaceae bacterium]